MMSPADKEKVRNMVSWQMMQTPPEFRDSDRRPAIRRFIRYLAGLDAAAQAAVEGKRE